MDITKDTLIQKINEVIKTKSKSKLDLGSNLDRYIKSGDYDNIKKLIDSGFDLNFNTDTNVLVTSIVNNQPDISKLLIDSGFDFNRPYYSGIDDYINVLIIALLYKQYDVAIYLIEKGIDINFKTKNGLTILDYII